MESQSLHDQKITRSNSVIGHITIYRYGKLYTPVLHNRTSKERRPERSIKGSQKFDRPELISKIHHLLNIHRAQREKNIISETKCSINIHKALQKAIRMCYEQKICESRLYPIGDLFLELFHCARNSSAIFSILLDSHMIRTSHLMHTGVNILYPNRVDGDDKLAFEYYLHHVSNLKEWNSGRYLNVVNREIDSFSGLTPLSAAVQKRDPSLVLVLLRYGADPFLNIGSVEDMGQDPTELLIHDLNGLFLFKNTGFSEETRSKLAAEEVKVWQCLTYFRRATLSIPLTASGHVVTTIEEEDTQNDKIVPKKVYNLHPNIANSIDMNFFKSSASLKHLCRCAIRNCLKLNRPKIVSLPKGIRMLPLPTQLKLYTDLQLD